MGDFHLWGNGKMNKQFGNYSLFRASIEHLDDIIPLIHSYRSFYLKPQEDPREYLTKRLERNQAIIFLAKSTGSERACAFTLIYPTFSTVSLSEIWLLNDLFVETECRGQGLANSLLEFTEQAANEAGATRLFLRTAKDNHAAQALYLKRGWQPDEVFLRFDKVLN